MNILEKVKQEVIYNYRLKRFVSNLLQQRFVVNNFIYTYIYKNMIRKKMLRFEEIPLRVMVENTNICNSNCIFCPHQKMKRKAGIMKMELFKKIVGECKKFGVPHMTVHGFGEPLLDKDFFKKVKYAKEAGIPLVTTNTNGMYLTKGKINMVFESGLDEIYISFDAVSKETYRKIRPGLDFVRVEKNILNLMQQRRKRGVRRPRIILSFVENEKNCLETKRYLDKWNAKVDKISVSFLHNWGGAVGEKLIYQQQRDPCRLLWTDLVISWDGKVPLCCVDYENKLLLGDIKKQSILQIWQGEKLEGIRRLHQKKEFNKVAICQNCVLNQHFRSGWWKTF